MSRRQLAADVPEFLEIVVRGALGGFDAERRVAARAAAARHPVAEFLGFRKREKPAKALEATIDELLVDPMILDDDEAEFLIGRRDVLRELGTLGLARIECWNGVRHGRAIVPTA